MSHTCKRQELVFPPAFSEELLPMPREVAVSAKGVTDTAMEMWRVVEDASLGLPDDEHRMAFVAAVLANMLAVMAEQTNVDIAAVLNAAFERAGLPQRMRSADA
jgi:hypothetical protein